MTPPETKEKNQNRKSHQSEGRAHHVPSKRLTLHFIKPHPPQQNKSHRAKKQRQGLKNPAEIIRLLPSL